jgi:hypothetical protein
MGTMKPKTNPIDLDELAKVELYPDAEQRLERAIKTAARAQQAPPGARRVATLKPKPKRRP